MLNIEVAIGPRTLGRNHKGRKVEWQKRIPRLKSEGTLKRRKCLT